MRLTQGLCALLLMFGLLAVPSIALAKTATAAESLAIDAKYAKYDQLIVIDKSSNLLGYYEAGKLIKSFPVGTGRKASLTPEGLFVVQEKIKNRPYYKEKIKGGDPRNPLGDRWLGLKVTLPSGKVSYAYGIHGTSNEKSIGKYVSSGCVRMHNKDVRWLFEQIKTKTTVLIRK